MPTRYVYDIKREARGRCAVLHLCKQLLQDRLRFCTTGSEKIDFINCSASTHFIRYKVRGTHVANSDAVNMLLLPAGRSFAI